MRSSPSSPTSRRATSACRRPGLTSRTTTATEVKVAIFGSGGVGGYFGARLAAAGNEMHFIARGAHLPAMPDNGLKVESTAGDFHLPHPPPPHHPPPLRPLPLPLLPLNPPHT